MLFNALYIEDLIKIIEGFVTFKNSENFNIYNVANPSVLQLDNVCAFIGELVGKEVKIILTDKPVSYCIADIAKLTKLLLDSFQFTSIETGLKNMVQAQQKCVE